LSLLLLLLPPPSSTLFPYTTLFRSRPFSSSSTPFNICDVFLISIHSATSLAKKSGSSTVPYILKSFPNTSLCSTTCTSVLNLIRSEEHTSELQSRFDLVCRLLLETK